MRMIPAGQSISIKVRFDIDIDGMLRLIATAADDAIAQISRGQSPRLAIPIELEGSLWVNVEQFGKIGTGFGPYADTWVLN